MSSIDRLWDTNPDDLTPGDYAELIAYYRGHRYEKPEKEKGPEVKIDLVSMGLIKAKQEMKRRI